MGRRCPETGEYVLYTACLECEKRSSCGRTPPEKPVFALLVVGTRTFEDYDFVSRKLDATIANIRDKYRFLIVSGGARGVDTLAEAYAANNGMEFKKFPADWGRYGRSAGYIRNKEMHAFIAQYPHRGCCAFWDGRSLGTAHSFELAKIHHTQLSVIRIPPRQEDQTE